MSSNEDLSRDGWQHKRGNHPDKFKRRKVQKELRIDLGDELDLLLNAEDGESPLILFELSINEWNTIQPNSIYLSDIYSEKPPKKSILHRKIYYRNYELGSNILNNNTNASPKISSKKLKMKDENTTINVDVINGLELKDSMMAIVTDKAEIGKIFKNIVLMTSSRVPITSRNEFFFLSGKVVLFLFKHANTKDPKKCHWNDCLLEKLKTTKPNICVQNGSNNHFHSQGFIAAWGNKALYARSSINSTVGQYVTNKPKKEAKIKEVDDNNIKLDQLVADKVEFASSKFNKWFPNFKELIAPILNVAYNKQNEEGNINFKLQTTSADGLWQSELCANAMTRDFHTEKDVTYTLISVPDQDFDNNEKGKPKTPIFLFQINGEKTIGIKMHKKVTFIFNGTMLTHRQYSEDGYEDLEVRKKINNFYNVACYGNQRLYNHLQKSFRRQLGLEK